MLRNILLKYYYVWFQAHKRSKYAHEFSHYWFSGFLQVCATLFFSLFSLLFIFERSFSVDIIGSFNKWTVVFACFILPSTFFYYILFHYFKADKENDDPSHLRVAITKRTRVIAWIVFLSCPLICFLLLGFGIRE